MMHYPQLPDSNGWDVAFYTYRLADDWLCTESGPVTGIQFWVSHEGYNDTEPPYTPVVSLRIHTNTPAAQSPSGYDIPGGAVWSRWFTNEVSVVHAGSGEQGWMRPTGTEFVLADHTEYFQYNVTGYDHPFDAEEGQIYWLSMQITPTVPHVGWKTAVTTKFGENAMYNGGSGWTEVYDPVTSEDLDYAFSINGIPNRPYLHITPQGSSSVVLSWQDRGAEDTLEAATNLLDSPIPWQGVAAPAVLDSGFWLVEDPATNAARFYRLQSMWPEPEIAQVEPDLVATGGGTLLHIIGQNFRPGQWIRIGGILLTDTDFLDSTHLTATLPALAAGYYDVELVDSCSGETLTLASMSVETAPDALVGVRQPPEPAPAAPCGSSGCGSSSPGSVHLSSGEFHHSVVDLIIPGRGLDFVWARQYGSRLGADSSQGSGWDHSYNIYVQQDGTNMVVHNGGGRADTFYQQPDGSYVRNEFFQTGTLDSNDVFTLKFPDTGTWEFNPLDGSAEQGMIASIRDRNGNTLTCSYDGSGRLNNITDTLGRNISVGYGTNGLVETVSDFAGRTLTYAYYEAGDAGGSAGDLKSVTSPPVTGTPNGNDFPGGKTTTYTYSKGFSDERLNHNLLFVLDAKGQTNLVNVYSATTNDTEIAFDRIVRQEENDGEFVDFSYTAKTPVPANDFAVVKTIVNDRMGNVGEWLYDARSRCLNTRAYTGRAEKTGPTTETVNRPANPLRPGDPAYYETSYAWNADSKLAQVNYPNGSSLINSYEVDYDPNAPRRARGNLRDRTTVPGPLGGDQASISQSYVYDTTHGSGCCGFNFATEVTDGLGNTSYNSYDENGNKTNTIHTLSAAMEDFEYNAYGQMTAHTLPDNGTGHRRVDEMTYYPSGSQAGYLHQRIVDSQNLALTTSYEYDTAGNVVQVTDPRGNSSSNVVNQLSQVVRTYSQTVDTTNGPVRYQRDMFYDANNNLVQVDVQNVDDLGLVASNTYTTTSYAYDDLNRVVTTTQEVDSSNSVVTQYAYDANGKRTLVVSGEASNGNQTNNVVVTHYDERNLPYQVIRAPGDPDQSSTQFDYDASGNLVRTTTGLEDVAPRVTTHTYDGYNRRSATTDPMGNVTTMHYDENGKVSNVCIDGELADLPGSTNNVRLAETAYTYDDMNRLVQTDQAFFDLTSGTNIMGGHAVSATVYSPGSQMLATIDANNHTNSIAYDTANRKSVVTDPMGNSATYVYDANGNTVLTITMEVSDLGSPSQVFTNSYAFDALNRMVETADNIGNTTHYAYDSRGNRTKVVDAKDIETVYEYDNLNRLTRTIRDMDGDGADANDAADIVTTQSWDDNSRLVGQTDDKGNATSYAHDALNRVTSTTYADGTSRQASYDVHNNRSQTTGAAGNVVDYTYDGLNRLAAKTITPGAGVSSDTTYEDYQYDGLSRVVRVEDDDSVVTASYDSLSNVTRETLNGQTTAHSHDGLGNKLSCTYPGGRAVSYTYDAASRVKTISDGGGAIASYDYIGPSRPERRDYGNGTRMLIEYDGISNAPGDFGVKKVVRTTHSTIATGAVIDDRTYTWNPTSSKTRRKDIRAAGPRLTHDYSYDAIERLVHTAVSNHVPVGVRNTDYGLDGVGNRTTVAGSPDPGVYTMDGTTPEPADDPMNQYTTTPVDSRLYDKNSNLSTINSGLPTQKDMAYDYRNQMVEVTDAATGQIHTYSYDPFGRRIEKVVDSGGIPQTTRYFYDSWQVVEERDGAGTTQATYVYGNYIDEVLTMQRTGNDYYYHSDDQLNVMAVTDSSGNAVERCEYQDYGEPEFFNAAGTPIAGSAIANPYLFTGRRYDAETGLYYYRTRYLDPAAGRFVSGDAIGIWGDAANLGNAFSYVGGNPWSRIDPMGLANERGPYSNSMSNMMDAGIVSGGPGGGGIGIDLGGGLGGPVDIKIDPDAIAYANERGPYGRSMSNVEDAGIISGGPKRLDEIFFRAVPKSYGTIIDMLMLTEAAAGPKRMDEIFYRAAPSIYPVECTGASIINPVGGSGSADVFPCEPPAICPSDFPGDASSGATSAPGSNSYDSGFGGGSGGTSVATPSWGVYPTEFVGAT